MTVAKAIEYLQKCPPDALLVVRSVDHSYRLAGVELLPATTFKDGYIGEHYEGQELEKGERMIEVAVCG